MRLSAGIFMVLLSVLAIINAYAKSQMTLGKQIIFIVGIGFGAFLIKSGKERKDVRKKLTAAQKKKDAKAASRGTPVHKYENVPVVVTNYIDDRIALKDAKKGDYVNFVFEPYNEDDKDTVRVADLLGRKLGYIEQGSEIQNMIHEYSDGGRKAVARIDSSVYDMDIGNRITLCIEFYDKNPQ